MPIQAQHWTDYLNCPVCCREFEPPSRSPISLVCGHTLCRLCLRQLHTKKCPFDQTLINLEPEDYVVNTALLQLAGHTTPAQPYHPPAIQALSEQDRCAYDIVVKCMEYLAVCLKFSGSSSCKVRTSRFSRPMQRKLVMLLQCAVTDEEGRGRAARAARSLGERTVTELILQHQNPLQISAYLWAAVRSRGCQFLGPAMQEEVLKLVLLALEDGSALSRKVLVMFVVQSLKPHFPQASKTSIGHVVQLLYRASCFKVSKRESDSSLMQLKEEFRTYASLRREHDAQIVQIAIESGLRIAPDQWSALLYGDSEHKSHMQSIIDKLQTPQSFAQSVQELFIALQRTGVPAQLIVVTMNLEKLSSIDPSPDAKSPSWQQLADIMTALQTAVVGLLDHLQQQATGRDPNHNHKPDRYADSFTSQAVAPAAGATPAHNNFDAIRPIVAGNAAHFPAPDEDLDSMRWVTAPNVAYIPTTLPPMSLIPIMPMATMPGIAHMPAISLPPPTMPMPPQPIYGYNVQAQATAQPSLATDTLQPYATDNMAQSFVPIPDRRLYQRFNTDGLAGPAQSGIQSHSPYGQEPKPETVAPALDLATRPYTVQDGYENRPYYNAESRPEAPVWQPPNDAYLFEHRQSELPSTSQNVYYPPGWEFLAAAQNRDSSNRADDELEKELEALEKRIYTEFRNAD